MFAPGVAGDAAALLHPQQNRIVVAVEPDLADRLHVPEASPFFHSLRRERDQ